MLELRLAIPEALIQGALVTDEALADLIVEDVRAKLVEAIKEVRESA